MHAQDDTEPNASFGIGFRRMDIAMTAASVLF